MVAMTPGPITFLLSPVSKQVKRPGAETQAIAFPAAAAAGPTVAPMAKILLGK
jgi:tRNA A37 threonylcarbamoyladenosine synthetase subunit TsaC/SUA5/YrdC